MKLFLTTCLFFATLLSIQAQTRTLNVQSGYGSGTYQVGDTVHVWSEAYDYTKTFSTWIGDIQFLERPKEWHTTLIMPNQDVSVTATRVDMPPYSIEFEQIMGANNLKNVYYHFPTNPKGIVFFFHGTNGSASNLVNNEETRSFLNAAIADSYGVIITESEETTLNTDLNSDGKLRWKGFPLDTINGVDFLNIKALKDTFIVRNDFSSSTPLFSVGISNGGSFSAAISQIYAFKAGVSYIASSITPLFEVRENPFAFRMALYDDHEEVGSEGNYQAWQHDSILQVNGICHDYEIYNRQPIYPQRFARIQGISLATSMGIYSDLLTNGELDANKYALHSDTIKNHVLANPSQYPSISSLSTSLQMSVLSQIGASNAEHKFFSDYNQETISFLNLLCSSTASVENQEEKLQSAFLFPNPANTYFQVESKGEISCSIYDVQGNLVSNVEHVPGNSKIDIEHLPAGFYLVRILYNHEWFPLKLIVSR